MSSRWHHLWERSRPVLGIVLPGLFMLAITLSGVMLSHRIHDDGEAMRDTQHRLLNAVDAARSAQLFFRDQQENWRKLLESDNADVYGHYRRQLEVSQNLVDRQLYTVRSVLDRLALSTRSLERLRDRHQRLNQRTDAALPDDPQLRPLDQEEAAIIRGLEQQLDARFATLVGDIVLRANNTIAEQNRASDDAWRQARSWLLWLTATGVAFTSLIAWRIQVASRHLKRTLETLQHAQRELVHSEKLAALGSLVAGVAHELNTPLGNAVLLSTTLEEQVRDFSGHIEAGSIRRSDLREFCEQADQNCRLLDQSLKRSVEIVSHFKQVAVDQSSDRRRPFDLKTVVREVTDTLQPQFKGQPHRLETRLPESITMESYPGAIGQIINNLVLNALHHGLEGLKDGRVEVSANNVDEQTVRLTVRDTGHGIPEHLIDQVFDPFYTSKLGTGGSGLGLYIVHNLVTGVLGGQINLSGVEPHGCRFDLDLPRQAPIKPQGADVYDPTTESENSMIG